MEKRRRIQHFLDISRKEKVRHIILASVFISPLEHNDNMGSVTAVHLERGGICVESVSKFVGSSPVIFVN
jgi:hypothetical protein